MKMSDVSCEVIRDLIPNCIDGIASADTETLVNAHIEGCSECRAVYESMRGGQEENAGPEKKEIDYLRKNKKRNRRIVIFSILGALLILLAAGFLRFFVIGGNADEKDLNCRVKVAGSVVKVTGSTEPSRGKKVSRIAFSEEDGVVTIKIRTVFGPFIGSGDFEKEYEASKTVTKVVFNDHEIWTRDPEQAKFSAAMRAELIAEWERYNKLSEMERLLLSTSPGYRSKYFSTWEDAVTYFGNEPFNPFEAANWIEKMNFVGTDKKDDFSGDLLHANVTFIGNEEGDVSYAGITAGYRMSIRQFVLETMETPVDRVVFVVSTDAPDDSVYVYSVDGSYLMIGLSVNVTAADGSNNLTSIELIPVSDDTVRVTFTAEPLSRLSDEADGAARRYTRDSGVMFVASTEHFREWVNASIFFDYNGVHYTVRIYDLADDAEADTVIDHVIAFIEKSIKEG